MEKAKRALPASSLPGRPHKPPTRFSLFPLLFSLFSLLAACGAPGDPTPRRPPVPVAITDLAARQVGETVILTFTLPSRTVDDRELEQPPDIEIFRWFQPPGAIPDPQNVPATALLMVPSALVDTYRVESRARFPDRLKAEDLGRYAGQQAVYMLRTRASKRRASGDSNLATTRIYPVPERTAAPLATVTESAVELTWQPPQRTTDGAPLTALVSYRVFRAEADVTGQARATGPALLGTAPSATYRDTQFEFGRSYVYTVRSVAQYDVDSVESADSDPVAVTPRDIFPPKPPENLVAAAVAAAGETPTHIELTWSLGTEPDLAGYHVYRSEEGQAQRTRLTAEVLLTPRFRDMGVEPGRRYVYVVTTVDRAGNESPPSVAAAEVVPPN